VAGFTDASKSSTGFYFIKQNTKMSVRFIKQFRLEATEVLPNNEDGELMSRAYFSIFSKISEFCQTPLISKIVHYKYLKFKIKIVGHTLFSLNIITAYFTKFPLLGKRGEDFLYWKESSRSRFKLDDKEYRKQLEIKPSNKRSNISLGGASQPSWKSTLDNNVIHYLSGISSVSRRFSTNATNRIFYMTEERDILEYIKRHPGWLTGFIDAEGNFTITLYNTNRSKVGYEVNVAFQVCLHRRDEAILNAIKGYFGVGRVYLRGDVAEFKVRSVKYFESIIVHFEQNPLITKKSEDYLLFKKGVEIIKRKEHLSSTGLNKIIALRASMNKGLSSELLEAFPEIQPVQLPLSPSKKITDPEWLAGFTSGEGTFYVNVRERSDRPGYIIQLIFKVSQHIRDELIIRSLIEYFDCGNIYKDKDMVTYRVQKFSDIDNKIMPFFSKHRIGGVKYLDYLDWCKAVELVKNKDHLTEGGLAQLRNIKAVMNLARYNS